MPVRYQLEAGRDYDFKDLAGVGLTLVARTAYGEEALQAVMRNRPFPFTLAIYLTGRAALFNQDGFTTEEAERALQQSSPWLR